MPINLDSKLIDLYSYIETLSLETVILVYLIGYVFAVCLRNLFGADFSTNFNFNKKIATGFVFFYFFTIVTNIGLSTFYFPKDYDVSKLIVTSGTSTLLIALLIYMIVSSNYFMNVYFRLYAVCILVAKIEIDLKDKVSFFKKINFKNSIDNVEFGKKYYLNHLAYYLPNWLIVFILMFNSVGSVTISLLPVLVYFICSTYLIEFNSYKSINETDSTPWMFSKKAFGYSLKHTLIRLEK